MECWKCQAETGSDAKPECDRCLEGLDGNDTAGDTIPRPKPPAPSTTNNNALVEFNWNKVKSTADVIAVLRGYNLKLVKGSTAYWELKRFLKD